MKIDFDQTFLYEFHARKLSRIMKILVTGCAGFIGSHVSEKLLKQGNTVLGIDNLNDYYKRSLKLDRLKNINKDIAIQGNLDPASLIPLNSHYLRKKVLNIDSQKETS